MQVCWLKRDLRMQDHAPLLRCLLDAPTYGPVLPMYVHEPSWWSQPDTSGQHLAFSRECLSELAVDIQKAGGTLFSPIGEVADILEALWRRYPLKRLVSYQETNTLATFERDLMVKAWCRARGVEWVELPQNGVSRGAQFKAKGFHFGAYLETLLEAPADLPKNPQWAVAPTVTKTLPAVVGDKPFRQRGGRTQALKCLDEFLSPEKLLAYPRAISSPNTAVDGCSRLSPYLAFGAISDGEVFRALNRQREALRPTLSPEQRGPLDQSLNFFVERLYWRAAYLQSFELDYTREHLNELSQFNNQREGLFVAEWLEAWKAGRTGVPYVDAAMRMLAETGWLNMRLRGTVTSFAVNELWLPWRQVGLHLAREFLDYEASIHWSQLQIHAGTAKGCEPLTYNPRKQAKDHDPSGQFVKRWVPELRGVPLDYLVEPWTMPPAVQAQAGCFIGASYPAPLINLQHAHEAAKERVAALRKGFAPPPNKFWLTRDARRTALAQGGLF